MKIENIKSLNDIKVLKEQSDKELKHLDEEFEQLKEAKRIKVVSQEEYNRELEKINRFRSVEEENIKTLVDLENAYNIVMTNLIALHNLNEINIRDRKDAKNVDEERKAREAEVEKYTKVLPDALNDAIKDEITEMFKEKEILKEESKSVSVRSESLTENQIATLERQAASIIAEMKSIKTNIESTDDKKELEDLKVELQEKANQLNDILSILATPFAEELRKLYREETIDEKEKLNKDGLSPEAANDFERIDKEIEKLRDELKEYEKERKDSIIRFKKIFNEERINQEQNGPFDIETYEKNFEYYMSLKEAEDIKLKDVTKKVRNINNKIKRLEKEQKEIRKYSLEAASLEISYIEYMKIVQVLEKNKHKLLTKLYEKKGLGNVIHKRGGRTKEERKLLAEARNEIFREIIKYQAKAKELKSIEEVINIILEDDLEVAVREEKPTPIKLSKQQKEAIEENLGIIINGDVIINGGTVNINLNNGTLDTNLRPIIDGDVPEVKIIKDEPTKQNKPVKEDPTKPKIPVIPGPTLPNKPVKEDPTEQNKPIFDEPKEPNIPVIPGPTIPNKPVKEDPTEPNKPIIDEPKEPNIPVKPGPTIPNKPVKEDPTEPNKPIVDEPTQPNIPGIDDPTPRPQPGPDQEEKESKHKRGIREIIKDIRKDYKIGKKDGQRYARSNLNVTQIFLNEMHSGNYQYNIIHLVPGVVKAGASLIAKLSGKLMTRQRVKDLMKKMKDNIDALSDEDLEVLWEEYRGNFITQERYPKALTMVIQEKMQEYAMGKVEAINIEITNAYRQVFVGKTMIEALDKKINDENTPKEEKQQLLDQKNKLLKTLAENIDLIREKKVEGNKILSGGLHGLNEDVRATESKMNYVGFRFAKDYDLDVKLEDRLMEYEKSENKARELGDYQGVLDAFLNQELLLEENTEVSNSWHGKITTGKKQHSPLADALNYSADPFIRDLFTTIAFTSAAVGAINAFNAHRAAQEQVDQFAKSVHDKGQQLVDHSPIFRRGMRAQSNEDVLAASNSLERQALDQSSIESGSWMGGNYTQYDEANHQLFESFNNTTQHALNNIAYRMSNGQLTEAQALQEMVQLQHQTQSTLTDMLSKCYDTLLQYRQVKPQFALDAPEQTMQFLLNHSNSINNMNEAMLNSVQIGEELLGESATMVTQLPSDLLTTLAACASSALLAYKVSSTMSAKYGDNKYHKNAVTDMFDDYREGKTSSKNKSKGDKSTNKHKEEKQEEKEIPNIDEDNPYEDVVNENGVKRRLTVDEIIEINNRRRGR